jgi:hypothetical protein
MMSLAGVIRKRIVPCLLFPAADVSSVDAGRDSPAVAAAAIAAHMQKLLSSGEAAQSLPLFPQAFLDAFR